MSFATAPASCLPPPRNVRPDGERRVQDDRVPRDEVVEEKADGRQVLLPGRDRRISFCNPSMYCPTSLGVRRTSSIRWSSAQDKNRLIAIKYAAACARFGSSRKRIPPRRRRPRSRTGRESRASPRFHVSQPVLWRGLNRCSWDGNITPNNVLYYTLYGEVVKVTSEPCKILPLCFHSSKRGFYI